MVTYFYDPDALMKLTCRTFKAGTRRSAPEENYVQSRFDSFALVIPIATAKNIPSLKGIILKSRCLPVAAGWQTITVIVFFQDDGEYLSCTDFHNYYFTMMGTIIGRQGHLNILTHYIMRGISNI